MRFLDANVLLYAVLTPKGDLSDDMQRRKNRAKGIFRRINEGEEVTTTVVHLSEIANIFEDAKNLSFSIRFIVKLLRKKNIHVQSVSADEYLLASSVGREKQISVNDALALVKMDNLGIEKIYSFDKHFDQTDKRRIET